MFATSNTSRTLKYLRDIGYTVGVVERFLSFAGKFGQRKDLFGIIDLIAIKKDRVIGVQSCGQAFSTHHIKIIEEERDSTIEWLQSGGEFLLIGWRKVKKVRGGKAMIWKPRLRTYFLAYEPEGDPSLSWEDVEEIV